MQKGGWKLSKTEIKNAVCVTHQVCGLLTRSALCCVWRCTYGHSAVGVSARLCSLHCNNNVFLDQRGIGALV